MRDALSRAFFLALARSNLLKAGASRYPMFTKLAGDFAHLGGISRCARL